MMQILALCELGFGATFELKVTIVAQCLLNWGHWVTLTLVMWSETFQTYALKPENLYMGSEPLYSAASSRDIQERV